MVMVATVSSDTAHPPAQPPGTGIESHPLLVHKIKFIPVTIKSQVKNLDGMPPDSLMLSSGVKKLYLYLASRPVTSGTSIE
jgi:hypothetical protein